MNKLEYLTVISLLFIIGLYITGSSVWAESQLSEQKFEIEADLTVKNVQSYPTLYGNWTVRFNTTGTADLVITPVDGTKFGRDIEFLELRCGDNILTTKLIDGVVFVENYTCNETAYGISKVLTTGKHTLEFRFGDDAEHAYNTVSEFKVQRGIVQVSGTTYTLRAPNDFEEVSSLNKAFVRITNTHHTGAGADVGGAPENADDVTATIIFDNTSTITITRPSTALSNTRVAWEIIEYTGSAGGPNEFVVRKSGIHTFAVNGNNETEALFGVSNVSSLVGFVTGIANPDTARADYHLQQTSIRFDNSSTVRFERGTLPGVGSDSVSVSYAVVEFTGSNWKIQRVEHTYTSAGVIETETITSVNNLSRAFLHVQKRVNDGLDGLDEFGHEVWLSANDTVSFQLESGADTPSGHTSVAWVIENTQTSGTPMKVERGTFNKPSGGSEPSTLNVSYGPISDLTIASVFANDRSTGTGTYYPRGIFAVRLVNTSNIEFWYSDNGQTQNGRWQVVEWPTSNYPPTTPTNIQCNGSNNCNITVNATVEINASGSTDADGDNITYFVEAYLLDTTTTSDQEPGTKQAIARAGGAWLNGWNYRKKHTITGSTAGAQTNYQIRFKVYNTTGTDSGENVYLGSNVQSDFGDVRFTNSSGTVGGLLDYWIEKYGSNYAIFWVEVDSIPASPGSTTIYIYYGNSTVATTSNGTATFLLYDDFEDGDINGWTTYGSGVCQYSTDSEQGGVILKTSSNDPNGCYRLLSGTVSGVRAYFLTNRINNLGGALDRYSLGGTTTCSGYGPRKQTSGASDDFYIEERSNTCGASTLASTTQVSNQNQWYKQMFTYSNQNMNYTMWDLNDTQIASITTSDPTYSSFSYFFIHGGYEYLTDNIRVMNYVEPEPAHGTWGSEETPGNDTEATKGWETYNNVDSNPWVDISDINVTVYVSAYDNSGSTQNGNNDPDLQLDLYNGSGWVRVGNFSIAGTGSVSLTTPDSSILSGWETPANRDLRIRGIWFDYYNSSNIDEINWTGVWVTINGRKWTEIGNHTETTTLIWDTTGIPQQNCVDLRARAIDLNGSNTYSDYYTKGACLNISHVPPAVAQAKILLGTNRVSVWAPYYGPELVNYEPDESSFKFRAGALVMDVNGKPLQGEDVTFKVYSNDSTLKATITNTTNTNGIAYTVYNTKGDFTASNDTDYGTWQVVALVANDTSINATRTLVIDISGYTASGCSRDLCHNSPDEADVDGAPKSPYTDKFGSSTDILAADAHAPQMGMTDHTDYSCETCHSGYGKSSGAPATSYPWGTHTNVACTNSGCHGPNVFTSFPPNMPSCYDCHPQKNTNLTTIDTTTTVDGIAGATVYSWNHEVKAPLTSHTNKTYSMTQGVPCWICHGPMHNITKPDPSPANSNTYTEDSQCKTCHSPRTEHNNQVKCTVCHSQDAHNISYFNTTGNFVKNQSDAGNCTTCHQQTAAWSTLLTQPKVGTYSGSGPPQVPAKLNHSNSASAGQKWGNYWTSDLAACRYCHGNTKHNASALGRPANWKGTNTVNSSINAANTWCAGCHYQGYSSGSDSYSDMTSTFTGDGLSVPPEITGNPTYAPDETSGYFNHSLGNYSDKMCKYCHGWLAESATNISAFLHNVGTGRQCENCHFNWLRMNGTFGKPVKFINETLFNKSVHGQPGIFPSVIFCTNCHTVIRNATDFHLSIDPGAFTPPESGWKWCEDCHVVQANPINDSGRHNITDKPQDYNITVNGSSINVMDITDCTTCHSANLYNNSTAIFNRTSGKDCRFCHTFPNILPESPF